MKRDNLAANISDSFAEKGNTAQYSHPNQMSESIRSSFIYTGSGSSQQPVISEADFESSSGIMPVNNENFDSERPSIKEDRPKSESLKLPTKNTAFKKFGFENFELQNNQVEDKFSRDRHKTQLSVTFNQ